MKRAMLIIPLISVTLFSSCSKKVKYLELPCKISTYEDGVLMTETNQEIEGKNIVRSTMNTYTESGEINETTEDYFTYDDHGNIATRNSVIKRHAEVMETISITYERKYQNNFIIWEKMAQEDESSSGRQIHISSITEREYKDNILVLQKRVREQDDGKSKLEYTTISEREVKNKVTIWQKNTNIVKTINYSNSNETGREGIEKITEMHREIDNLNRITKEKNESTTDGVLQTRTTNTYTYTGNNKNFTSSTYIAERYTSDSIRVAVQITNNQFDKRGNVAGSIVYTKDSTSSKSFNVVYLVNGYDKYNNCIHEMGVEYRNDNFYIRDIMRSYHKNNPDMIEKETSIRINAASSGEQVVSTTKIIKYDEYDRTIYSYIEEPDSFDIIRKREAKCVYDQLIPA